ncbi:MAG: hypothetical protein IJ785_05240 [Bacteroidales bacterium]|nr:hypothetical protein [Bacteroidales bacterium]
MATLKERAIKAIVDDTFSNEELRFICEQTFYAKKLREAMVLISTMEVADDYINDTFYSDAMEEIEEMRAEFLRRKKESDSQEAIKPSEKEVQKSEQDSPVIEQMHPLTKPKKVRNLSEETRKKFAENAAKARAAKAKKAKK